MSTGLPLALQTPRSVVAGNSKETLTADAFRALACAQPKAVEAGHMGKADFRVGGKIFATLDEDAGRGTLKLNPTDQATVVEISAPHAFPASGAWGARGWTQFTLDQIDPDAMAAWMRTAWATVAPKKLLKAQGG